MTADSFVEALNQRSQPLLGLVRRIPIVVWRRASIGVLSLWLCYSLAQLVWVVMPEPNLQPVPLTSPRNAVFTTDTASVGSGGVDIDSLKSLELFGKPGAVIEQVAVAVPEQIDAPDTNLKLVLRGVAPSEHEPSANAIIADGARQELFFPHQELTIGPRGVKLIQVKLDRVILDNNGKLETLWLYQDKEDFRRSGQPQLAQNIRRPPIPVRNSMEISDEPGAEPSDTTAEFVNALRPEENQLLPTAEQIKSIDDVIGISMYREGGQLVGFRIRPKRNRQVFDELGLQPNDVVTAVNNVGLSDTSQAMELYRSLSQTTQVSLEILRDGATVNVDINLDNYAK
jgi:general secretion pathway protein C